MGVQPGQLQEYARNQANDKCRAVVARIDFGSTRKGVVAQFSFHEHGSIERHELEHAMKQTKTQSARHDGCRRDGIASGQVECMYATESSPGACAIRRGRPM